MKHEELWGELRVSLHESDPRAGRVYVETALSEPSLRGYITQYLDALTPDQAHRFWTRALNGAHIKINEEIKALISRVPVGSVWRGQGLKVITRADIEEARIQTIRICLYREEDWNAGRAFEEDTGLPFVSSILADPKEQRYILEVAPPYLENTMDYRSIGSFLERHSFLYDRLEDLQRPHLTLGETLLSLLEHSREIDAQKQQSKEKDA